MKNQQCSSCGGDCGYGPLRHCQQGINHETDFRNNEQYEAPHWIKHYGSNRAPAIAQPVQPAVFKAAQ